MNAGGDLLGSECSVLSHSVSLIFTATGVLYQQYTKFSVQILLQQGNNFLFMSLNWYLDGKTISLSVSNSAGVRLSQMAQN